MDLGGARNRNHPRFLRQHPRKCYLSRRGLLVLRKGADNVNQGLVRFAIFGRETRDDIAEVTLVESRILADHAGEEAFTERAEGNESDAKFFERGRISASGSLHHREYSLWRAVIG